MYFFTIHFPEQNDYVKKFQEVVVSTAGENDFSYKILDESTAEVSHFLKKPCIDFKIHCVKISTGLWETCRDFRKEKIYFSQVVEMLTNPTFKRKFCETPERNQRPKVQFDEHAENFIKNRRRSVYVSRQPATTSQSYVPPKFVQFAKQYSPNFKTATITKDNNNSTNSICNQFPELIKPKPSTTTQDSEWEENKITITHEENPQINTFLRHIFAFVYGIKRIKHTKTEDQNTRQLTFVNSTMAECFVEKIHNYDYSNEDFGLTDLIIKKQPNKTIVKIQDIMNPM